MLPVEIGDVSGARELNTRQTPTDSNEGTRPVHAHEYLIPLIVVTELTH